MRVPDVQPASMGEKVVCSRLTVGVTRPVPTITTATTPLKFWPTTAKANRRKDREKVENELKSCYCLPDSAFLSTVRDSSPWRSGRANHSYVLPRWAFWKRAINFARRPACASSVGRGLAFADNGVCSTAFSLYSQLLTAGPSCLKLNDVT